MHVLVRLLAGRCGGHPDLICATFSAPDALQILASAVCVPKYPNVRGAQLATEEQPVRYLIGRSDLFCIGSW
jgi:hypothetical protein